MAYVLNNSYTTNHQDRYHDQKWNSPDSNYEDDTRRPHSTMAVMEADLSGTKYNVIYKAVEKNGFYPSTEQNSNTFLIWNDAFISAERVAELKPYQKINHMPGMSEISRKDTLAKNMAKLGKALPEDYDFVPKTWTLPADTSSLISHYREIKAAKKSKFFIVKPANGAQGHGIWLTRSLDKLLHPGSSNQERQYDGFIIQEYIEKPFLIDGFKCDLRIYALVVSCDPLRIFLYSDGLVRFATEMYRAPSDENVSKLFMHLTNYAVNKNNAAFERGDSAGFHGSKRSLRFLTSYLRRNDIDVAHLWRRITDLVVKTILAAEPHLLLAYRSCRPGHTMLAENVCFELLGFDILLDEKLKPWLLEVNRSPSFATDTDLDKKLKTQLLNDTLSLLNIRLSDRSTWAAIEKTQSQRRLLRPNRRSENDLSAMLSRHSEIEELETLLYRIRLESAREDYENRHCGSFRRVFPPADMFSKERFGKLLLGACTALLPTRSAMLLREIEQTYLRAPKEEEICERLVSLNARSSSTDDGANPQQAQLYNLLAQKFSDVDEDGQENEDDRAEMAQASSRKKSSSSSKVPPLSSAKGKAAVAAASQAPAPPPLRLQRSARLPSMTATNNNNNGDGNGATNGGGMSNDELAQACLDCLRSLHIRFPGKSESETDAVLLEVAENWAEFRSSIATYWLVRLDHSRRKRLLDIVKSNVWAVVQQIWGVEQPELLPVGRTFQRLFNRLLWNNGQGLWNTFSVFNRSNWESIFAYSTYPISVTELNCCRRVVQLCRDCLLIVYKFAEDARSANHGNGNGASKSGLPSPQGLSRQASCNNVATGRKSAKLQQQQQLHKSTSSLAAYNHPTAPKSSYIRNPLRLPTRGGSSMQLTHA